MTEQEMRDLFREMREEPMPPDSLARVRLGVAERINARSLGRSWRGAWKIAAVLVMAGCIVAGFLLLRPARTVSQPAPDEIAKGVAAPASPAAPPEMPAEPVSRQRRSRRQPQRVEIVPVSIRIETPDPDVVILFVN